MGAQAFPALVACLCLAPTSPHAATPPPPAPLRWGADAEGGAPFIFKDPADPRRHIGFEVEIAQALAREVGRPVVFRQYERVARVRSA